MAHERQKPTRTFMNTDYGELAKERYKDFKDGYNKAVKKAAEWLKGELNGWDFTFTQREVDAFVENEFLPAMDDFADVGKIEDHFPEVTKMPDRQIADELMADRQLAEDLMKETPDSVKELYNEGLLVNHPFFSGSFTYGLFIGAKWMQKRINEQK